MMMGNNYGTMCNTVFIEWHARLQIAATSVDHFRIPLHFALLCSLLLRFKSKIALFFCAICQTKKTRIQIIFNTNEHWLMKPTDYVTHSLRASSLWSHCHVLWHAVYIHRSVAFQNVAHVQLKVDLTIQIGNEGISIWYAAQTCQKQLGNKRFYGCAAIRPNWELD